MFNPATMHTTNIDVFAPEVRERIKAAQDNFYLLATPNRHD